ncbi:family 78 glycoside hydrolase catalytic domain [Naasia sp. SYSU D00948]|uniref:family 78 glycoside hydrolase catalytic domain n=1 Tax=Naasia sp. SYSU D00948 TaxID=2817379 RepID=UPI0027DAD496|nr:family 78 glycoside hydrolase catalytic domain [Naasia sp. SYSU D00948]
MEHHREPMGIGESRPRLSWWVTGGEQAAYEVRRRNADGTEETSPVVHSAERVLVDWPFPELASREACRLAVRLTSPEGIVGDWSQELAVEAGLLHPGDWTARFAEPGDDRGAGGPAHLLRRSFRVGSAVRRARLYATAHGLAVFEINGRRVSDELLAPGWTSYEHRLRYRTADVTPLLQEGENALGAHLADGWYRGRFGFDGGRINGYGERVGVLAQLEIEHADGSRTVIESDGEWTSAESPVRSSNIYDGEEFDARLRVPGWSSPGFDDGAWAGVTLSDARPEVLVAPMGPPVRATEVLHPVAQGEVSPRVLRLDFGQNLVGRLRIRLRGPRGASVTLRHAEVLEHGQLGVRPLRAARATDRFVLGGAGEEEWEPEFTFHGFRYAEIASSDPEITVLQAVAVVLHTDMEETGSFSCSDPLVERLHENSRWGMRGNFIDVPTDCPQRDERLGWTGDINVFTPAATGLYDCSGMLASWMEDLLAEQRDRPDGIPPLVVPDFLTVDFPSAIWGDAVVDVPWVLHERYGDARILARALPGMTAYVDAVAARAGTSLIWDSDFQLGDWLDPSAPADEPGAGRTSGALVATAYFARSAERTGRAAALLGEEEIAERYLALAGRVRDAFAEEFVSPRGRVASDSQTGYAIALTFGLLPTDQQRRHAGERLAELVHAGRYRIGTGFAGTPLLLDALVSAGHPQLAHRMLAETGCPSFLYPVTMGATTVWERWDSMLPDGTINPGEMTSFNHYALGAVADWLQRRLAGLAPAAPGYRRIIVEPVPGGSMTSAAFRLLTPYGPARSSWTLDGASFELVVEVPEGTTAEVRLPDGRDPMEVGPGRHTFTATLELAAYPPAVPPAVRQPPVSIDPQHARR